MPQKPAKIIYFPMEITSRELDSRLLLTSFAASRGFEVVLGQKWLLERNIEFMTPGVYLSKTLTRRDAKTLKRARAAGYITAAIDEEIPGLVVHDRKFWWVSRDAVENADLIFLPGTYNSSAFGANFELGEDRLRRVGNPRWDLLRQELRSIFAQEVDDLLRRYGDFILINTNFGTTNSQKGDARQMIQGLIDQGKVDANDTELLRDLDRIVAMEGANRATLIELLPAMVRRFPNQRIILRPHPSEDVENWHKWLAHCPQVQIVRQGAAVPWILASRVLIHTNCTTGVEAIALDKPAICLLPTESSVNRRYLANLVNPVTTSVADTLVELERVIAAPECCYSTSMIDRFRDSMSFDPNCLGAESMIEDILALGNARGWCESSGMVSNWRTYGGYRWRQKDKNVRGILFPEKSLDGVARRLEQYASLLGLDDRLRLEACGSKTILVSARPLSFGTRIRRAIGALKRT
ncbi:surface carbohydrate biosynthesis protein [Dongia deserti]|uniref:surface carbohydrate biosynthesis protein n=1 Tax=Dongia deserti TaxID=2268030 RepID=UPI000E6509CC|nr:surface carbohydrate biosynthesis protein [Dongia deserti]